MSTRATIKFKAGPQEYYVYKHCDGYDEGVLPDISEAIEKSKGRWSGSRIEWFVTFFLSLHFDTDKQRHPSYSISCGWHGDSEYEYLVEWDNGLKAWKVDWRGPQTMFSEMEEQQ